MGADKLFMPIGNQSLLSHTIKACQVRHHTVKLSAPPDKKYDSFGLQLIPDYDGCQGPLAGIIASLTDCSDEYCFITAADFPGLDSALIDRLHQRLDNQQYLGLCEPGGIQPLCGIYAVSALPVLLKAANDGITRVTEAIGSLRSEFIEIDHSRWLNVNSPADLEESREIYG